MNSRIRVGICCALWTLNVTTLVGEDWPRLLGPRGDGTSTETGLVSSFPETGPPRVFSLEIGTGYAAPSVRGKMVVLHHRLGGEEIIDAMERNTGKLIWRHKYPTSYIDPYGYNNGPRCTPLLTKDRVFTYGAEGQLYCLELETGKVVWHRDTARDWKVPQAFFGVGSTPIIEGDKLIVMIGGQPNSGMAALEVKTGKTVWESVGQGNWEGVTTYGWRAEIPYRWKGYEKLASYASPVATTIHGRRHLLCFMRQGLCSVDPANGKVLFSRWFQSMVGDSVNAMNPVVLNDMILISGAYYRVGAMVLQVKPDGKSIAEVWKDPKRHPLDPNDRDPSTGRWKTPALEIHWMTPVLHDGHVYAFSGRNEPDATFRCVEFRTGKVKWNREERWRKGRSKQPDVYGRGSLIMADGKLIALGEGGLLGIFKVDAKKDQELARWQVPELHYPCWAAPVLSDKKVYLRSEDRLVCLDLAATKK